MDQLMSIDELERAGGRFESARPIKSPPQSLEAEQAVLGGVLIDNDAWERVSERVVESDFFRKEHRYIFNAMDKLAGQSLPLDYLTVADALERAAKLSEIGGMAYLIELAQNTPSAANILSYADIVRERAVIRQLIGVGVEIAESGYNPEGRDSAALLDQAESKVFNIAEQRQKSGSGPESVNAVLKRTIDRIEQLYEQGEGITGISTGFADLDGMTSGLQPSDLVIVAGRPSMGKTTFAMNIAEHVALTAGKAVLVFSMEMPSESILMRSLSSLGRIDQNKVRSGQLEEEDWSRLTSAMGLLNGQSKMFIDDTGSLTPTELRSRARRVAREQGGLALIVVDYLQLMQVPGLSDNRTAEISEISRSLKSLAKELSVPMVALSQLNRSLEQRSDKRPVMSDLRESGAIEQDADLIMFVYRDEVYNPETADKGTAEIIIGKQRNGPIGRVRLTFQGRYTRFDNYAGNQPDEYY